MNLADVKNWEEVDTKETNKSMAFAVFRGYQRLRTPQEICYGTIELGREPGAQYSLDCNWMECVLKGVEETQKPKDLATVTPTYFPFPSQ